jgi:hypothetical protein
MCRNRFALRFEERAGILSSRILSRPATDTKSIRNRGALPRNPCADVLGESTNGALNLMAVQVDFAPALRRHCGSLMRNMKPC